ncbi:MAG: VWA domain-containing protein [Candidatus Pacearchaeota archaeon]|nr:VWA domain-containing protein [Candidatus Pacearchaeota archaeon]
MIKILSSLKVNEIDNQYITSLISDNVITDLNKSLLEQIGEFYITNISIARGIADSVLSSLETKENIGIWYGSTLISSKNSSPIETAKNIEVARQIISGIGGEGSATGFSSRAYLSSSFHTKYFSFGGYVGEGNISALITYNGSLNGVKIEITTNKDFDIYINNLFSGHYEKSASDFTPAEYELNSYIENFHSGENIIKLSSSDFHISGGYIKITYEGSEIAPSETRYYFPGIEGIINLYDGFYIPGTLQSITARLHLNTNYSAFLKIGTVTVFNGSTSGEQIITLSNSLLSSLLDYPSMSEKTTPLRLGIENGSYVTSGSGSGDVFSVNDISGSMGDCISYYSVCTYYCESPHRRNQHTPANTRTCNVTAPSQCAGTVCGGTCGNPHSYSTGQICNNTKLDLLKNAAKSFINLVLNNSQNRVGLVGYSTSVLDANYHPLSNNSVSLINNISNLNAGGTTCICCGVNKAADALQAGSYSPRFKSMVVMSDGQANVACSRQGTGNPGQDAIQAACQAYQNYGIRVYVIGFGTDVDTATLQAMANCGNGAYYYSDVSSLTEIYQQVSDDIIQAVYSEQTISSTGNILTRLYPDSSLEFFYNKTEYPYGMVITNEKKFDNSNSGNFSIPKDSILFETKVISYSGPRWTSLVKINDILVYNLSVFGKDYTRLGDPFSINIPNSFVNTSNIVNIFTGLSYENQTSGSEHNKIIYTIIKNISSYSPILSLAEGCIWHIDFEDSNATIKIPDSYSGVENCYYQENKQEYNINDAVQSAVFSLLKSLDLDSNNKIDIKFSSQEMGVSFEQIVGIPYSWSTEVQVRKWY